MIPISTYNIRKREMELAEEKLLFNLKIITPWQTATLKEQQISLETCRTSLVVAIIIINGKTFPSEPANAFQRPIYEETRKKLLPDFNSRIAKIRENNQALYFFEKKTLNKSSWLGNEDPILDYNLFGYINPNEKIEVWFKNMDTNLPFQQIINVYLEKSSLIIFEHSLYIVHIVV